MMVVVIASAYVIEEQKQTWFLATAGDDQIILVTAANGGLPAAVYKCLRLLYMLCICLGVNWIRSTINAFPRLLENFHANTIIETLPTSPIPGEDSDSLREEIDIFTGTDDLMPPGIESDDYDSEGDIHFLEELFSNDSIPLSENESSNFDHHDDPLFSRPPPEPPNVEFFYLFFIPIQEN
nr:hypothetical protein [Tanacetum cinerariifolium]